jgi:predicted Zn-dependent protease
MKAPWRQSATPRQRRRFYLAATAAAAVLTAGAFGAYEWGRPAYERWKSNRAVKQARAALDRQDFGQAAVALRIALSAGITSDGETVVADYYERRNSPRAIEARKAVVTAEPRNLEARIAWAMTATRFHDYASAQEALQGATRDEKKNTRYQTAVVVWAMATGQMPLANFLLDRMRENAPDDRVVKFMRAAALVHHPSAAIADAARRDLADLAKGGPQQLGALRLLMADAFTRRDAAAAKRWAQLLAAAPGATFADLLNSADSQLVATGPNDDAGFDSALRARIEGMARGENARAALYTRWLLVHGRYEAASGWLDGLSSDQRSQPEFKALRADVDGALKRWDAMEAELGAGAWGPTPAAAINLAFAARALQEGAQGDLALRTWRAALDASRISLAGLIDLNRLADLWQWPDAVQAAVAAQVQCFPSNPAGYPRWVVQVRAKGSTAELRDALDGWRKADSASLEARYNWAMVALLADRAHPDPGACAVLEGLYKATPGNPYFATGAAFARFCLGEPGEALSAMAGLQPVELKLPERSPYIAAVFAANERWDEARAALRAAPAVSSLLPEEADLLRQAATKCGDRR